MYVLLLLSSLEQLTTASGELCAGLNITRRKLEVVMMSRLLVLLHNYVRDARALAMHALSRCKCCAVQLSTPPLPLLTLIAPVLRLLAVFSNLFFEKYVGFS